MTAFIPPNKTFKDLKIRKDTNAIASSNVVHCLSCGAVGKTLFYTADIPSFGGMDITSFNCEKCGYRYSKTSSNNNNNNKDAVSEYGMKTTLTITDQMDLQRSVIIHDEAIVCIPELDIQVRSMLGGKITTIEGAISSLYNEIKGLNIIATDSNVEKNNTKIETNVSNRLQEVLEQFNNDDDDDDKTKKKTIMKRNMFKFCLIDPLNKSFISPRNNIKQNKNKLSSLRDDGIIVNESNEEDPNLFLEQFERNEEEKLILGLQEGENEESRATAKALWGEDFDKGYEFIPNPNNEPTTVTKTSGK